MRLIIKTHDNNALNDSTDLFHLGDVLWFSYNSLGHDDERILFCTNDPHVKLISFWDCSLLSENKNNGFESISRVPLFSRDTVPYVMFTEIETKTK